MVPQPTVIRRVEDRDGNVLFSAEEKSTRAISDITSFLMTTMLADVINAGTGARARQLGFTLPAAGKTGTTNDFNDAWFVGYTPSLVAGVWVGFDQPHTILPNGFAADLAVPLWTRFMKVATEGDKPEWLVPPSGVTTATVCRMSGKLATEGCQDVEVVSNTGQLEHRSMVYTEYFARGTVPEAYCEMHPTRGIMTRIAGLFGASDDHPAPVPVQTTGLPPAPPQTGAVAPAPDMAMDPAPEAPKKKRGFWSKLFGVGREDNKKIEEPNKKKGGE
jgi:membrane carboxypeptidase/penicillin-binding protein